MLKSRRLLQKAEEQGGDKPADIKGSSMQAETLSKAH